MSDRPGFPALKIGILGCRGIPNHYGGYEQFAEYLSLGLVEKGHEVYVYISTLHPYRENHWRGVRLIRKKDPEDRLGPFGQFVYDYHCLRDARRRGFDVLLQLGYTSSAVWYRLWPKDAVNIVHLDGLEWKRNKYSRLVRYFLKKMEALVVRRADALIADSPAIRDYTRRTYNRDSAQVAYGAETGLRADPRHLEALGLEPHRYFLAISRFVPENNLEMILEGFLKAPQVPLVLIGNLDNRYGRRLAKRFNHPSIRFAGAIYDKPALDSLRTYARLYFHGHSVGGTNPSLLEAMACKTPVCAHRNDFNAAVLGADAFYFSDSDELGRVIREQEPDAGARVKDWVAANYRKIEEQYRWKEVVEKLEAFFWWTAYGRR